LVVAYPLREGLRKAWGTRTHAKRKLADETLGNVWFRAAYSLLDRWPRD